MNEKYNRMKKIVLDNIPDIPNLITNDWLKESLNINYFNIWGFTFNDLSNKKFDDNIDKDLLRRVNYSSKTNFGNNSPIRFDSKMISDSKEYKILHEDGVNGEGVNLAVIDYGFVTFHDEIKNTIVNDVTCEGECHFHGSVVSSILAGNNIGICPKSKIYFFETPYHTQVESVISSLKKIYDLNNKGANIRVVNISAILHRQSEEFEGLVEKLRTQGCYVIDSKVFGEDFVSINKDFYSGEYYYNLIIANNEEYMKKAKSCIGVYNNTPLIPLYETENDYVYCGQVSNSWTIPVISGLFALCLQINKDLTYEEFVSIAKETKIESNDITVINPIGIINKLKNKINTK